MRRYGHHSSNTTSTAILQSPALSPEGLYAVSIHVHVLIKGQDGLTLAFHRLAQSEATPSSHTPSHQHLASTDTVLSSYPWGKIYDRIAAGPFELCCDQTKTVRTPAGLSQKDSFPNTQRLRTAGMLEFHNCHHHRHLHPS